MRGEAFPVLFATWLCACSSGSPGTTPAAQPKYLGALCSEGSDCASGVCLLLVTNEENVAGLCSEVCATPSGCSDSGVCVAETTVGQSLCFQSCIAPSDCQSGVPCVWDETVQADICTPIPSSACTTLATQGTCAACLGASCCDQVKKCAEDTLCSKLQGSCPSPMTCSTPTGMAGSDPALDALAACSASSCAMQCP